MSIRSFSSHSFESLAEKLRENMRGAATMRQVVVTGGGEMKEWVTRKFVASWGVAFGFKVLDLASAVDYFSRLSGDFCGKGVPSRGLFSIYLAFLLEKKGLPSHVSDRLAKIFLGYGKNGGAWLKEWSGGEGWQQEMWREVEKDWSFPKLVHAPKITHEVHLFGISDIPSLYRDYFEELGKYWNIYLYHFSPCGEFWEDVLSEKGAVFLDTIYEKEGVKESEREVFREIVKEVPPLLANYGKVGRENFGFFQRDLSDEDFSFECRSLLHSLQGDLVAMEEKKWNGENRSLQFHSAPSHRDEVEGLYKSLVHLASENSGFDLHEVRVYAPDISVYLPYIVSRFGCEESPFTYTVSGLPLSSSSSFLQGYIHLLSLADGRWYPQEVLSLFHCRAFAKKHDLSLEDIRNFKQWVHESRVRWGYDGDHRGSWHEVMEKWVMSLAVRGEGIALEMSDAPLVGKIFHLLTSLHEDLQFFRVDRSLEETVSFLRAIMSAYFVVEEEGEGVLLNAFKELSTLSSRFPNEKVSFSAVYDFLRRVLSRKKGGVGYGGIVFHSLQSGNIPSAKVVAVLGMDEESFPRKEARDHLNEMESYAATDGETDRFALLETLFSVQETLILSHTSIDARDGKEVQPSRFSCDLKEMIERKGVKPFSVKHAPLPFDVKYFSGGHFPQSFSSDEYLSAKILSGPKVESSRFIPDFYVKSAAGEGKHEVSEVSTSDLAKVVRNPMQFYFNEVLGVYEQDELSFDFEGEFVPSPLDRYAVRHEMMSGGGASIERRIFPGGLFGKVAKEKVEEEVKEYQKAMEKLGIFPDEIFSLSLSRSCKEAERRGNVLILPALEFEGVTIHGPVGDVTSKGVVSYKKGRVEDALLRWSDLLIFSMVMGKEDCSMFFLGSGRKREFMGCDGRNALRQLLRYYTLAKSEISPLHPAFFENFFAQSEEAFVKQFAKSYAALDFGFVDRYFGWLQKTQPMMTPGVVFEKWAPIAQADFAVFHDWAVGGSK